MRADGRNGQPKKTHRIRVDDDTYAVIKDMQRSMRSAGVKKPSMCESLKVLLCHRQPGGWIHMVERARMREERRRLECLGD